ncbi:unnamed protein product [Prorocentrum cordatum]|uniref:Charged multivesicular body protein 3 n=1 Tax=Prorocentrum cordatum TaxID=2364126 RepID=A0ABN9VF73_9DINO|nr:unnamed protein product [Polarella glacialis]
MGGNNSKKAEINAKLKAKEWQWQLKTEVKHLDREIKKIQTGEAKLQAEIRKQAEAGQVDSVQMLAKSVVKSRKAVQRLEKTKVNMHAVDLQLTTSLATMSTASSLKLSTEVMQKMNKIAGMPEVGETMRKMQAEMAKCAEVDGAMEAAFEEDGEADAAAVEVQRVLEEMALDQMGPLAAAAAAPAAPAPVPAPAPPPPAPAGNDDDNLMRRLANLKNV